MTTIRVPASTVEKLRLEPDDILFNEGGDRDKLGRGWIWEGQVPDCIHQNHVFRARLRTDEFDPKFVSMHGNTFGRTWFETMGKQTTNLASVSLTTLKAFPIPKVPIDEQRRLVTQVEAQTSQIVAFERIVELALRRAAAFRSAILSSAFTANSYPRTPTMNQLQSCSNASQLSEASTNGKTHGTRGPRPRRGHGMSEQPTIVQKLWNYCNVLRDDGLSYQDYIEQLTFLLFLKMADEQTKPPFSRPAIVPAAWTGHRWCASTVMTLEVQYRAHPGGARQVPGHARRHLPQGAEQDPGPGEAEAAGLRPDRPRAVDDARRRREGRRLRGAARQERRGRQVGRGPVLHARAR